MGSSQTNAERDRDRDLVSRASVIALLRHETFDAAEHVDEFSRGWIAALRHVAELLERAS